MECYRFVNLFTRKFGAWILRIEKRLEYFYFFYLGVTLSSLRLDSYLSKRISASPPNAGLAITKQYCHAKERSISDRTKLRSLVSSGWQNEGRTKHSFVMQRNEASLPLHSWDPSYPRDDKTKGGQNTEDDKTRGMLNKKKDLTDTKISQVFEAR